MSYASTDSEDIKSIYPEDMSDLEYQLDEINDILDAHKYLRTYTGIYDGLPVEQTNKAAYRDREIAQSEGEERSTPYDSYHYERVEKYYQPKIKILENKLNKLIKSNNSKK